MAGTAADHPLTRLSDWGTRRIFGYPGDGINGILGALDRTSDSIVTSDSGSSANWYARDPELRPDRMIQQTSEGALGSLLKR